MRRGETGLKSMPVGVKGEPGAVWAPPTGSLARGPGAWGTVVIGWRAEMG